MRRKFYISDIHFSHHNILKFEPQSRPYEDVDHMNEDIIRIWNSKVKQDCDVYIIGDLGWDYQKLEKILPRLNGKKYLIKGNHDNKILSKKNSKIAEHFEWIKDYEEISDNGTHIVMSHYPMITWNRGHYGSVQLYGHIHSLRGGKAENFPGTADHQYNVGWDVLGAPCTLDELITINEQWWKEIGMNVRETFTIEREKK